MGHPVVHFEIQAKDDAAAKKFYKKIFGWKIDSRNPMKYGMVSTKDADGAPGINGGLFRGDKKAQTVIYVQAADPGAVLKKIERAGGKTIVPVTEIPNMVMFAIFADPEGNQVGLVKG